MAYVVEPPRVEEYLETDAIGVEAYDEETYADFESTSYRLEVDDVMLETLEEDAVSACSDENGRHQE